MRFNKLVTKLFFLVVIIIFVYGCKLSNQHTNGNDTEQADMHTGYDDSTLTNNILPVLMPYNRVIDPAGKVIAFGNPDEENHSMDVKLVPGSILMVVEDRYGIALIDTVKKAVIARWAYRDDKKFKGLMSTYSGIKVFKQGDKTQFLWSAAGSKGKILTSLVLLAEWDGTNLSLKNTFSFDEKKPSPLALPNDLAINQENDINFLYVVLNGNDELVKINLDNRQTIWTKPTGVAPYGIAIAQNKIFVSNWAGTKPTDTITKETAGIPYGKTYIDPKTGAVNNGTVSVLNTETGDVLKEIQVDQHPNAVINSPDNKFIYVANGNSDNVSVIAVDGLQKTGNIPVKLMPGHNSFIGDTPNALAISNNGGTLYVANGLDNAVAVVKLGNKVSQKGTGNSEVLGFIPTEAYPGGLAVDGKNLFVTNLEGEGARVSSLQTTKKSAKADGIPNIEAFNSHHQFATVSIIPIPDRALLNKYTEKVKKLNLVFRETIAQLIPRKNVAPKPVPERIGEPSVFSHVLYIIKENRTYDQVLGDMPEGNGQKQLCIYGDSVTPNQHNMARNFLLLDNYYASGKCSAEGHQWTDAGMVTDYVEKSVRAWFRSYPHVQEDALVYDQKGFIWNNALDHGKTVRIYGEASKPHYDETLSWQDMFNLHKTGKKLNFTNTSTISRVRPILSQNYPGSDELKITDQLRATAFIDELKDYEKQPCDQLPNLMVMALSTDHTQGIRPEMPVPESMVADNDLALGRIVEAMSKSRFWKNTVIFVTEDDSQGGWDHVSAYRTTGFVISPYSRLKRTISTNYNQTSLLRTIEQILGVPPMNIMDATALPMFNCFDNKPDNSSYQYLNNKIPLDNVTPKLSALKGNKLHYAKLSLRPEFDHIDGGSDDLLNRILWYAAKGNRAYPAKYSGKDVD